MFKFNSSCIDLVSLRLASTPEKLEMTKMVSSYCFIIDSSLDLAAGTRTSQQNMNQIKRNRVII